MINLTKQKTQSTGFIQLMGVFVVAVMFIIRQLIGGRSRWEVRSVGGASLPPVITELR